MTRKRDKDCMTCYIVSGDKNCSPLPIKGDGFPLQREPIQTALPVTAISQFPSAQNNPYAKVASSGGGIP